MIENYRLKLKFILTIELFYTLFLNVNGPINIILKFKKNIWTIIINIITNKDIKIIIYIYNLYIDLQRYNNMCIQLYVIKKMRMK